MRRAVRVLLVAFVVCVCFAVLLCFGAGLLWAADFDFPATEILREFSPDGEYEVLVEQLGSPQWPFGPVTARITVKYAGRPGRIARWREEVMNDGGGLYPAQFAIDWLDGDVKIAVDPDEALPKEYVVNLTK